MKSEFDSERYRALMARIDKAIKGYEEVLKEIEELRLQFEELKARR